jgi:hydroxypyruvate reductase
VLPERAEVEQLERAFAAALAAVAPERLLPRVLAGIAEHGPAVVLGAGKGAAAMAAAFHAHWHGRVRGFVVTRYGHGLKPGESSGAIEIVEAGHPSPDEASVAAGKRLLELARSHRSDERLFFLVSGGGSALASQPIAGIELHDKREAANYLMHAGAGISEINCVRKHLSGLKGGRLAVAADPAKVTTYAISDVPGDDIGDIASGPTIPDRTTQADAIAILERYAYPRLSELQGVLSDPSKESPKPNDPAFADDEALLIGSAAIALDAAAGLLRREGYEVLMLGDDLDQEAEYLGREHAALAKEQVEAGRRVAILSGGETRVVLSRTGGRGGRNLVYLSGLALELDGHPGIYALAADTDGIDGHGDHAGGIVLPSTLAAGRERGVSLATQLAEHDTYRFFDGCNLLLKTGPTRTNVNDFRLILCHP